MSQHSTHSLRELVARHKSGDPVGMYSICSANRFVLESSMVQASGDGAHLLIEATSNQVDQYGGYTGMTPPEFVSFVREVGASLEFPVNRVILGGDHLGPNVWRQEGADLAMEKASGLVRSYVEAGFSKIHLDASMRCVGDPGSPEAPLPEQLVAERAARLCSVAESAWDRLSGSPAPVYVIGTEVPPPGGAREELEPVTVTGTADAERTIEVTKAAFVARGLEEAWERVIAVVVQPGVEFGDTSVVEYDREAARDLSRTLDRHDHMVFEAHSTDYQTRRALRQLVEDHFAILKVGPRLTFALREALFALYLIESEWLAGRRSVTLSSLLPTLEKAMLENPGYWQGFYHGNEDAKRLARSYSYSDRCRYYWPHPEVQQAVGRLFENLEAFPPPLTLLSQYMPLQYRAVREGRIRNTLREVILHGILEVTADYAFACRSD